MSTRYLWPGLLVILLCGASRAQFSAIPLSTWQAWGHEARALVTSPYSFGVTGADHEVRRAIGDVCDLLFVPRHTAPGSPIYHPFLFLEMRCFVRSFFLASLDAMLAAMDAATPQAEGVRFYYVYGSGVVIEAFLPDAGGNLVPYRIGMDISDAAVFLSDALPLPIGCIQPATFDVRWAALADRLDALFVSHWHPDHWSARLMIEMTTRSKPVHLTPEHLGILQNPVLLQAGTPAWMAPHHGAAIQAIDSTSPHLHATTAGTFSPRPGVDVTVIAGTQTIAASVAANNVHVIDIDVPVDPLAAQDGLTIVHFGDENGPLLLGEISALVASGQVKDHVVVINYSNYEPMVGAVLDFDVRLQTPSYEFGHFALPGQPAGLHIPPAAAYDPAVRVPLFWGEGAHYPSEF